MARAPKPRRPDRPDQKPSTRRAPRTGPVGPAGGPTGPMEPPFDPPEIPPTAAFAALDSTLPLALLPIRIETRFDLDAHPAELRVRMFPDVIHADGHQPALTAPEQELGRAFWERAWRAGVDDVAAMDAAFSWLAGQIGAWRAAWVAGQTTPTNQAKAPTAPVPDGQPLAPSPAVPALATLTQPQPTLARLLPVRFAVAGYYDNEVVGTWWGNPIPADLPMAPGLADVGDVADSREWLEAQGLGWTFDFDEAVRLGMGLRIDLDAIDKPIATEGFGELVVLGVGVGDRREAVESLLQAHRYTRGIDFVPQGTPTNATEGGVPDISLEFPSHAAVRASELDAAAPADRPEIGDDGGLYRMTAADAASIALGLGRDNPLDRSTNAGLLELAHAEAMNLALWPALGGHYLAALLQGAVIGESRDWLRDWAAHYVRGAGPLPTLLVGAQPYGLLPAGHVTPPDGAPKTNIEHVEDVVAGQLRSTWDRSLANVPRLDPDATDLTPGEEDSGDLAALVSKILAAVPHPTTLRLRQVDDKRSEYALQYGAQLFFVAWGVGTMTQPMGVPYAELDDNPAWQDYLRLDADLDAATSVDEQLRLLEQFAADLRDYTDPVQAEHLDPEITGLVDSLIALVAAQRDRTEPVRFLTERHPDITRMVGDDDDPQAFFAAHAETHADWQEPLVAPGRTDADLTELRDWLGRLRDQVEGDGVRTYDYADPKPLLRQLLHWSVERATPGDLAVLAGSGGGPVIDVPTTGAKTRVPAPRVTGAMARLVDIAEGDGDVVGELERLLRETLGTWSYRLDAWYTALAAWRLENKRQAKPRGIQVGAYGSVVDVTPRAADASQGYVLAPSLSHATTAAVLRSGWAALGGAGAAGAFAVDLRSDRVRRAQWLVEGVRQGQDLGALLGARFERGLHDAAQDRWIDQFRQIALDARASAAAPNAIVDGLLVARAWSGADDLTTEEQSTLDGIGALLAGDAAADRSDLEGVLGVLASDLDAVADVALAQSVFSLAEGNIPEAAATLTASATGEVTFPPLRVADTPRAAATVTHRLLLTVDGAATSTWPGAPTSGRALAAPGLEALLAKLLGDPAALTFTVRFDDPASGEPVAAGPSGTLADLGLSALDLVFLAPVGDEVGSGRLGALLAAWGEGRRPAEVPATAVAVVETHGGDPSVDDVLVAARSLRRLVAESRDLDGRDLASPGATDAVAGFDIAELDGRVTAVRSCLAARRAVLAAALPAEDGTAARADVRAAMLALAGFHFGAGIPTGVTDEAVVAEGLVLLGQIDARLAQFDQTVVDAAEAWPAFDDLARHAELTSRIALLLGHQLAVAPLVRAGNGAALDATFARPRLAGHADATGWLAAAGRVQPGARRLRVAIDLVEAARNDVMFDFALGQLPDNPDEAWAAVARPTEDERGRLCLLAAGHRPAFGTGPVAGLVVDSWTESIPRRGQTAGLAVHFDAPSARPPQAILLCTAPPEAGFSFDLVRDTVHDTLALSRLRMVGPETLEDLGQYLPAAYLHVDTNPGGAS